MIEDNIIYSNGGGGIFVYEGEYDITNNVIYDNGHEEPYGDRWGGRIHRKPGGFAIEIGPSFKIGGRILLQKIYNNTCYRNARGELWIGGPWPAAPLRCVVKNNILVGGQEGVLLKVKRIGVKGLESDYNVMCIGQGGAFPEWNCVRDRTKSREASSRTHVGQKFTTFAGYRTATGMDKRSLRVEPGFVNAARHNFMLKPDSPCIAAGVSVGLPFKGKAPDIGARGPEGKGSTDRGK